eukprot:236781_1
MSNLLNLTNEEKIKLSGLIDARTIDLKQLVQDMAVRLQELEQKVNDDAKVQEHALVLENDWKPFDNGYAKPTANKIGNVVYLKGLVTGGNNDSIVATLPA